MNTAASWSSRVPQEPKLNPDKNVLENVEEAVSRTRAILQRFDKINARLGEPLEPDEMDKLLAEQARVQDQIEALNAWELDRQIEIAMEAMNLPPGDADVSKLSGGERRRVGLCKILLERPDLLLLDEPTNHLDAEAVSWLERHLADYAGTVVAVTHDRYFLDNAAGWILELDRGRGIPWEGKLLFVAGTEEGAAGAGRERLRRLGKRRWTRELEWIRMAPKARQAKSKARIRAYEQMSAEKYADREDEFEIQIPPGKHLGELVVEADKVSKAYGDKVLFENFSFRLPAGGIVGVIGPNGAGKTTLFRMIIGQEKPDSGTIRIGPTVEMGYVDQSRDSLDSNLSVYEEISGGHDTLDMGGRSINSRAYVAKIQFQRAGSAEEGWRSLRRRAEPRASGEAASPRLQSAAARRTDERFGRRHAASLGRSDSEFRRLRGGHQPRPLVFGPRRHARHRLRGRRVRACVRREFSDV